MIERRWLSIPPRIEANAAMKSIVRWDSAANWREHVTKRMREPEAVAADASVRQRRSASATPCSWPELVLGRHGTL